MSLYAIADLHLSLGTSKPMDIFNGWTDYVNKLESNWKAIVKENDVVVISGDISWAMDLEETFNDFKFIDSLPGKKIFIKGNHDYWWATKNKIQTYFQKNSFTTLSVLFNSAVPVGDICVCGTRGWLDDRKSENNEKLRKREAIRLRTSIECAKSQNKEPIVFLHYPPFYFGNECSEVMDVLIEKKVQRCFYGHIHGKDAQRKAVNGMYKGIKFNLIACDYLNFTPYLVERTY